MTGKGMNEPHRMKGNETTDPVPLGVRLRERRRQIGLTLKDVADGAGLSVGFISQIERGIASPSLSSLVAVTRVLGVDVGEFLSQPRIESPLTRHNERPVYAIGGNPMTYERISASFPGAVLHSVIMHEPPGHRNPPITHEGEEIMFVLEGTITVELDGEITILEKNDSIHFHSSRRHATWNHSDQPATILWVGTMDVFGEHPATNETRAAGAAAHGSDKQTMSDT